MKPAPDQNAVSASAPKAPWNFRRLFMPSVSRWLWVMFFCGLILTNWRLVMISNDGDPCLHVRIGNWMIDHGEVIHYEQFSHTRIGAPLISKEWLSEVIFAASYRVAGWNGIVLLTAALIATTLWLLHRQLLAEGTEILLATGLVLAAAFACTMHWLARPHLTTHLLTVVFAWLLRDYERGRIDARRLWLTLPPLMVLWTNLHGAFFTGFVLIGIYFLAALRPLAKPRAFTLAAVLAACGLVSLINPNGWNLHLQILQFLRTPALEGMTNEFRSPNFHSGSTHGFLLLLFLLGLMLLVVRPRLRNSEILLISVWGYFSLHSVRNIPIFALTVTPILACYLNDYLKTINLEVYRGISANISRLDQSGDGLGLVGLVIVIMIAVVTLPFCAHKPAILETEILTNRFPVAAVDYLHAHPEAVHGEMFNDYGWGGYLVLVMPERKVFIDGRNDFYGEKLVEEFNQVNGVKPGWDDVMVKYHVGWTILQPRHPLNQLLALRSDWKPVYRDQVTVIYQRGAPALGK